MANPEEQANERPRGEEPAPTADLQGVPLKAGSRIGQFRIDRELGHGGAGIVYLARDTKLDRQVAIKSLPPEFVNDLKTQARFQREAKLLASLNHPNIATIHEELEEARGQTYLVLEYVPGETLGQRIARGPIALRETLAIALDIAAAMEAAHARGVIHRDLKPENVKFTPEGRAKVLDFGIAKMMGGAASAAATITEPGHVVGTPGYMSPEQARGEPADRRTDIWSFGCVLYEALAGKCAFPGQTATEALASILKSDPDWQALPPEAAPCLRRIIETCLQKDPEDRYSSAADLCEDLRKCQLTLLGPPAKALDVKALLVLLKRPRIAAGTVCVAILLVGGVALLINRSARIRWARLHALPQIIQHTKQEEYRQAFVLAQKAERYIPQDPVLEDLWPQMSKELSILTEPPGARVYCRDYADFEANGTYLGTTPLEKVRHPLGIFRWEFEKQGYQAREFAVVVYPTTEEPLTILLEPEGRNRGMVPIPAPRGPFWIDKHEVTNAQFQEFVDANGYGRKEFWKHRFTEDGSELSWVEATRRFVDRTGNPGPATWEWGTFPKGKDHYPVRGVSWYEADAYAQWAGKDLPVLDAWELAASPAMCSIMIGPPDHPHSNIGFREGPAPVGKHKGISRFGLYDAAGNVKEWCWNATDDAGSLRYLRGGAWADPDYGFTQRDHRPPMNREATIGFRCARYGGGFETLEAKYVDPIPWPGARGHADVEPISEQEFAVYRETIYGYSSRELNDSIVTVESTSRHWRKERIEFDAAYDGDHITAYLFLPKSAKLPYQPVVYFPGVATQWQKSSEVLRDFAPIECLIKGGRAVLYPVYKGTYERRFADKPFGWQWADPEGHLEWMKCLVKDVGRSIDYLEHRARKQGDVEMSRLTYYGFSWGAWIAPVVLAVEDRIQSAVLAAGGFLDFVDFHPAMDPVRFASRVKIPVLMVNGIYDAYFPVETSAQPMLDSLGTPWQDRQLKPYDGGHSMLGLFYWQIQKDVLTWMDKYPRPGEP